MKKLTSLLICLTAISGCARRECREFESLCLDSELLGTGVHYSVVLPADYAGTSERYPVLCLFHCIGGDCTTGIEYCDITHVLDSLVEDGTISPMIVVMPDIRMTYCADAFDGSAPYESMLTRELLPLVEKAYRTDGKFFTLGFSMGGFAAMATALRNPDLFCGYAAMSPSVRTDGQYCTEMPQEGWDRQWGNKFGGVGQNGQERLTPYYKSYSPVHLLADLDRERLMSQRHFIVVGDREGETLAESDRLLHDILEARGIPHYWDIGSGGHDFAYWRSQLPSALRFADAAFKGKDFNSDGICEKRARAASKSGKGLSKPLYTKGAKLYLPTFGYITTRKVPCVYVFGADRHQESEILDGYRKAYRNGAATPLAFCFISCNWSDTFNSVISSGISPMVRDGWRMRAAICLGESVDEIKALESTSKVFRKTIYAEPSDDTAKSFPEWLRAINYKLHD